MMLEFLNKELKLSVLSHKDNPNTYYLSYQSYTKCVIDTKISDNDMIIMPQPQGDCTVEELDIIIDHFCDFMFKNMPEINGILMSADPTPTLENIGFKLMSEDSEYLYRRNDKRINKVR